MLRRCGTSSVWKSCEKAKAQQSKQLVEVPWKKNCLLLLSIYRSKPAPFFEGRSEEEGSLFQNLLLVLLTWKIILGMAWHGAKAIIMDCYGWQLSYQQTKFFLKLTQALPLLRCEKYNNSTIIIILSSCDFVILIIFEGREKIWLSVTRAYFNAHRFALLTKFT